MTFPDTERRPVTETRHGETFEDPYRWLEGDDDEVASWVEAQNDHAEPVLDTPVRTALRDRFESLARVTDHGTVRPAGDRYLQQVRAPDEEQSVVYVRETPDGEGRVVANPNDWSERGTVSLDWLVPSPDGDLLAYGVAEGGDEQYDVHVVTLPESDPVETLVGVGRTGEGGLAWTDGGFYYVRTGQASEGGQLDREIRFHALDDPAPASATSDPPERSPDDDPLLTDEFDERTWPQLTADGDDLVVTYDHGWERSDVYYRHEGDLVPVVEGHDENFEATVLDGVCYLLTTHDAPRSRVLACDLDRVVAAGPLDPAAMHEVVPESDAVCRSVTAAGDDLLVHRHRDAASELLLYAGDGALLGELPVPDDASVAGVHADEDGHEAFFRAESFVDPPSVRRVDLDAVRAAGEAEEGSDGGGGEAADGPDGGGGETDDGPDDRREEAAVATTAGTASASVLAAVDVAVDADLAVEREWVTSTDGEDVLAFVVGRADRDRDAPAPTVLYGYGGFRINLTPTFRRFAVPFLEAGGVFVSACLRGGTEFGEAWHDAGRRERKRQTFDDAVAVAEALVERGYTGPERLGVWGGSNGGLLVTALLTQRPDLFGAAVAQVPLTDMLRFHELLLGKLWTREYGDPDDPEAFAWLREYSPYHNLAPGEYPATMLTTGAGDTRVHPGHARKFAAALQANQRGDAPVLLRSEDDAGHGLGKPTGMVVREQADLWGFFCSQLGVSAAVLR
jgi:prolyl oligopeptidase